MKICYIIIACFLLFSCNENRNNNSLIRNNNDLIEKEFSNIERQFLLNNATSKNQYHLAEEIKSSYETFYNKYLHEKHFKKNELNSFLNKIAAANEDEKNTLQVFQVNRINENTLQMVQIQLLTLYTIKSIKESIFSKDFPINKFRIETIKDGDKLKFTINGIDTTTQPCVIIGKLKKTKKNSLISLLKSSIKIITLKYQ